MVWIWNLALPLTSQKLDPNFWQRKNLGRPDEGPQEWSMVTHLLLQVDQMCKVVEVLGIPPVHIIERASRRDRFFEKRPGGNWVLRRSKDGRKVWAPVHTSVYMYMYVRLSVC